MISIIFVRIIFKIRMLSISERYQSFAERSFHVVYFSLQEPATQKLRIAIIGQSNFASDVLETILALPEKPAVVGVFTIPDKGNREDVLGKQNIDYKQIASLFHLYSSYMIHYSNHCYEAQHSGVQVCCMA